MGSEAIDELRRMLALLDNPDEGEVPDAVRSGPAELSSLVERVRAAGLPVSLEVTGEPAHRVASIDVSAAADKTHRGHAIIEQVHSDLKNSALAHLPSGKFAANSAWLVLAVIAFNLTRAAATLAGPTLARSTTATIRRKLIAIPARIASSARRVTLHLPVAWPWEHAWTELFTRACGPPPAPAT